VAGPLAIPELQGVIRAPVGNPSFGSKTVGNRAHAGDAGDGERHTLGGLVL